MDTLAGQIEGRRSEGCRRALRRLAILLAWLGCASAQAADRDYMLAVVPQLPTLEIHDRWQPLLDHLREHHGLSLVLRIHSSIPEFEAALHDGQPDFAYLNPYHQLMAKEWQGYVPLVRDGAAPLTGILVVRTDSPVRKLEDLSGAIISFPAPNAFGASLYMRALLSERHDIDFQPRWARTHANVYRQVVYGDAQAGGGVWRTLKAEDDAVSGQLQVLYETPPVAPHPIAAHPRVPEPIRQRFIEALVQLPDSEPGQALLAAIQMPKPVEADFERDYAPLQSLELQRYFVEPGPE